MTDQTPTALAPLHLPAMEALQDAVLADMRGRGQAHFIIPRTRSYLEGHLRAPHAAAGIFDGERLAAQALFHFQEFDAPDYTRLPALPGQNKPNDRITVIKGAIVHPDYQGQGYFRALIGAFLDWAAANNMRHALARVEITHDTSRATFEKFGFTVVNTVTDARDDAHVHVLHRLV